MNSIQVKSCWNIITIKMNHPEAGLRYAVMEGLSQYVMSVGIIRMPLWCVEHLDSLHMVRVLPKYCPAHFKSLFTSQEQLQTKVDFMAQNPVITVNGICCIATKQIVQFQSAQ